MRRGLAPADRAGRALVVPHATVDHLLYTYIAAGGTDRPVASQEGGKRVGTLRG
jgi:hypothetical protein